MGKSDIGIIGLAVMGENLAINMESKGFRVSVYNRTLQKVTDFMEGRAAGKNIIGAYSLEELVKSLKKPRKIMMMVKAGQPVDDLIDALIPLLHKGDIIIDGGNSHYLDTIRRTEHVVGKGLLYIGTGVSGGAEGALKGPSIMPGGSPEAWPLVKPIFQGIAAKVESGDTCCEWVGPNGAGHFVKMIHNGIEYGDMQLICEAYHVIRELLNMTAEEMGSIFAQWNEGELNSYLIEITAAILGYKEADGTPLLDKILDTAGQKGTGKWVSVASLEEGIPLTLISEAVYARYLSSMKKERTTASKLLPGPIPGFSGDRDAFIEDIKNALYMAKIISYAQGYDLMGAAAKTYGWDLDSGGIALMWRGGCIIRSRFLGRIKEAYDNDPVLGSLLLDPFFKKVLGQNQQSLRNVLSAAMQNGIPVPAFAAALSYYDGYRCERLPSNLLQAQRDYFGAHTYERVDSGRGKFFHTDWTGEGGAVSL